MIITSVGLGLNPVKSGSSMCNAVEERTDTAEHRLQRKTCCVSTTLAPNRNSLLEHWSAADVRVSEFSNFYVDLRNNL